MEREENIGREKGETEALVVAAQDQVIWTITMVVTKKRKAVKLLMRHSGRWESGSKGRGEI